MTHPESLDIFLPSSVSQVDWDVLLILLLCYNHCKVLSTVNATGVLNFTERIYSWSKLEKLKTADKAAVCSEGLKELDPQQVISTLEIFDFSNSLSYKHSG